MVLNSKIAHSIELNDIGVLLVGFNRPELLAARLIELSTSNLKKLYVSIDGGEKSDYSKMRDLKGIAIDIYGDRIMDWTHHSMNKGMTRHITEAISLVLKEQSYVVVVEDDVVLSENFLENILKGLNLARSLGLNGVVSGNSQLYSSRLKNCWKIVNLPSIWGWACSRDTWAGYKFDIGQENIEKELGSSIIWSSLDRYTKNLMINKFKRIQADPFYTWDTQLIFHLLKNDFQSLSPIFSISGNEGFGDNRAVHTSYGLPRSINNNKLNNNPIFKVTKFSKIYNLIDTNGIKHRIKRKII